MSSRSSKGRKNCEVAGRLIVLKRGECADWATISGFYRDKLSLSSINYRSYRDKTVLLQNAKPTPKSRRHLKVFSINSSYDEESSISLYSSDVASQLVAIYCSSMYLCVFQASRPSVIRRTTGVASSSLSSSGSSISYGRIGL
jgi:hypothetical protein